MENPQGSITAQTHSWEQRKRAEIRKALGLIILLLLTGTFGYMVIEGWQFRSALYMTVITVSTVGYKEITELSPMGEYFTIGLIACSMFIAAFAVSVIGQAAIEGEVFKFRRYKKMKEKISTLNNHIIICGFGRLGRFITRDLIENNQGIVIVETRDDRIEEAAGEGLLVVEGSAFDDDILAQAGIERAKALLAILPSDADNVFITLTARALNPKIQIFARTERDINEGKLMQAGANHVISPYRVSGARLVQTLIHPYVNDFLEIACDGTGNPLIIERITVPQNSSMVGHSLAESQVRQSTGITVAAIINRDGSLNSSPNADSLIEEGATLIVLGPKEAVFKLDAFFQEAPEA